MKGMLFAERYKLEDFIGQGGMSLVYRAVDIRTGHSVAVKILKSEYNSDKEFLERFQREAQAASLMSHHNIVNLLDVGVEGEYRYLVLEYVSGNTLKDIIKQKGRLTWQTAIQVGVRILSALQHAHDNGIIHRDIKPQNVLIHADGHVKVADFGIARMTNAFTISKGDMVVGSVHYSSPEQASGNVVEAPGDIYSTGVVMYEMLTGRVPFAGDTPVAVAMQHLNDMPEKIENYAPETPPAVIGVVMRAMAKDPKDRFQSAREMADALLQAREGRLEVESIMPPHAEEKKKQPPAAHPKKKRSHKKKLRWGYAILTTVLTIVALGMLTVGIATIVDQVANRVVAPDLVDSTTEEAFSMVKRSGLIWQQTEVNSDTIPAGYVISQIPEADTAMRQGDSILVTVSMGPARAAMHDYVGFTSDVASTALKNEGFTITILKVVSTEPIGVVLQQNPAGGQPFTAGQDVELTVSGGSTVIPSVEGYTEENAAASITQSGLVKGDVQYIPTTEAAQVGVVISQSPPAGTQAIIGSTVLLSVGVTGDRYTGQVVFQMESAGSDRIIRVVTVENQTEKEQYTELYAAGQSGSITVPLESVFGGSVICRVYVDGALYQEITAEMTKEER